jgi:hypothetical protein
MHISTAMGKGKEKEFDGGRDSEPDFNKWAVTKNVRTVF